MYTRRDLGKIALAALPVVKAFGAVNSKFSGVQIGAQTYSYRTVSNVDDIIQAMAQTGIGEAELMSDHAKEKDVRKKFDAAGIDIALLCYNMNEKTSDDEIEYAFQMAKALGVKAISTSTQITVAKRIAPFADQHQMMVGFHGHDNTRNPNEFATPESFAAAMSYSKYHGINLDIGHFTAANFDPLPFIREHYARITNLHLKDRKKNHGPNVPWGQGDTPIKEVLQLLAKEKYAFPANIEFEYAVPEGSDLNTEMGKCLKYCKDALA